MTVDFTQIIKDQYDQPLQDVIAMQTNGGKVVDLTLGGAVAHALMAQEQSEQLSGEDKFKRGALAFKCIETPQYDVKAEDVVLIKKQIAKLYSPIVVYRTYPMLDQAEKANG